MLVYQFWEGLNKELHHNCLSQGVPCNLQTCYRLTTNIELDLMEYQEHTAHEKWPHCMSRDAQHTM